MKVYGSDTDTPVNGYNPSVDDDEPEEQESYDYSKLFDAPNYADFLKSAPNSHAKQYEKKVQSMMKVGMVASLNNGNWADAATFIKHGPGVATAAGNLAAESKRVAQIIDMLTAPDSPALMFAMVALPMASQILRNHEPEVKQVSATWRERRAARKQAKLSQVKSPAPPITVKIFKREVKIPIRIRVKLPNLRQTLGAVMAPAQPPGALCEEVFNDASVVKALHKMGLYPQAATPDD